MARFKTYKQGVGGDYTLDLDEVAGFCKSDDQAFLLVDTKAGMRFTLRVSRAEFRGDLRALDFWINQVG